MRLIDFASIYLNGSLGLFLIFVLPGILFVSVFSIANFPQRWLVVLLSSLVANHLLVTIVASFHLSPVYTYRVATAVLAGGIFVMIIFGKYITPTTVLPRQSVIRLADALWMIASLALLCFTYADVWRYGVPNIFQGSDVSVSWNPWSLTWSKGIFPTGSYGYPQFVPTIWSLTYVFTGSTAQYFAYYTYIVFIVAPVVLTAAVLARVNWLYAISFLFLFARFVGAIHEPWLRSTLQEGFPDWIAAISVFCGTALFLANAPAGRFDTEKVITALASLCLVSIAATTKAIYGLFAVTILIALCVDAARYLETSQRNKVIISAIGLVAAFAAAYAIYYSHLAVRSMPYYPVAALSDRISGAIKLLNSTFTIPCRIIFFLGLAISPFLPHVRWLALPLLTATLLWASTASYDLRNLLGVLLIAALIPPYSLIRWLSTNRVDSNSRRQWYILDGAVGISLALLCILLTLPLALDDEKLERRFAEEQLSKGLGIELNEPIGRLLARGCRIFSANGYIHTVTAFQPYRQQMEFFNFVQPLTDVMIGQLSRSTGCTGIMYPPDRTNPSISAFIHEQSISRGYSKIVEHNGMVLLVSSGGAPAPN